MIHIGWIGMRLSFAWMVLAILNAHFVPDLQAQAQSGLVLSSSAGTPPTLPSEPPIKPVTGGLRLPSIIGDHMVLQRDTKVPIWGWAEPEETVTVTVGSRTESATADAKGKWRVDLIGLPSTKNSFEIQIKGKSKTLTLHDVLLGDVWFCSGQSNMEIPLSYVSDAATQVPAANIPTLRLFLVFHRPALEPQEDCRGEWRLCTPETAKTFSAVGYLFGKEIGEAEHVPVGLIGSYSGGSWICSWTSLEALQANPTAKAMYADPLLKAKELVPKTSRTPTGLSPDEAKPYAWADIVTGQYIHDDWYDNKGGREAMEAKQAWETEADAAKALGQPAPSAPPAPPIKEPRNMDGRTTPTMLFNGMLLPVIPYAMKGVIWYQGESDRNLGTAYRDLFPQMIADWRGHWNEGDFPFIFVQLAGFTASDDTTNNNWSLTQEAQLMTLTSSPNTAMAVADDIGDPKNVHPHDKVDLGHRIALAARRIAYGENVVDSGPLYDSFKVDGNKIHLHFKETGTGLKMGLPPAAQLALFPEELAPDLQGFMIAGGDLNFVPATATIDGATDITLTNDAVKMPVAARYSWGNVHGNLYNLEGLPASPFRTDPADPAPSIKPPPKVSAPTTNSSAATAPVSMPASAADH